jgi:hypothetical protein
MSYQQEAIFIQVKASFAPVMFSRFMLGMFLA